MRPGPRRPWGGAAVRTPAARLRLGLTVVAAAALAGPLAAQDLPVRQGLLSLETARLFYEMLGSGEPIIVVHGGPGLDHRYLRPGLDVLGSLGRLIYYDQRGTGESDAALDPTAIDWDLFVDDVEALRGALGHPRVTVLGHSFGARIALDYALAYPSRVRSLVLLNPAEPGTRWQEEAAERVRALRTPEDSAALAEIMASPAFAARDASTMSELYRLMFRRQFRDPSRVDELDLDLSGRTARDGPEVARLLGEGGAPPDRWDRLGEIEVPVLVVHGRADAMPVGMSTELVEALPRGQLAVLDTGHFPWVEDPGALLTAVARFLAGVER